MSSTSAAAAIDIPGLAGTWNLHSEGVGANLADLRIAISTPTLKEGEAAGIDQSEIYTFTANYTDPTLHVGVDPEFFGSIFSVPQRVNSAPIINMAMKGNSEPGNAASYYYCLFIGRIQNQDEIDGAWLDISVPASNAPATALGMKLTRI